MPFKSTFPGTASEEINKNPLETDVDDIGAKADIGITIGFISIDQSKEGILEFVKIQFAAFEKSSHQIDELELQVD